MTFLFRIAHSTRPRILGQMSPWLGHTCRFILASSRQSTNEEYYLFQMVCQSGMGDPAAICNVRRVSHTDKLVHKWNVHWHSALFTTSRNWCCSFLFVNSCLIQPVHSASRKQNGCQVHQEWTADVILTAFFWWKHWVRSPAFRGKWFELIQLSRTSLLVSFTNVEMLNKSCL